MAVEEVAKYCNVSESTVRRWVRNGDFRHFRKFGVNSKTGRERIYLYRGAVKLLREQRLPRSKVRHFLAECTDWAVNTIVSGSTYDALKVLVGWLLATYGESVVQILSFETLTRGALSLHPSLRKIAPDYDRMTEAELKDAIEKVKLTGNWY